MKVVDEDGRNEGLENYGVEFARGHKPAEVAKSAGVEIMIVDLCPVPEEAHVHVAGIIHRQRVPRLVEGEGDFELAFQAPAILGKDARAFSECAVVPVEHDTEVAVFVRDMGKRRNFREADGGDRH